MISTLCRLLQCNYQITIQVRSDEAEAVLALATLTIHSEVPPHSRRTATQRHAERIEQLGGEARMACRVRALQRDGEAMARQYRNGQIWCRRW